VNVALDIEAHELSRPEVGVARERAVGRDDDPDILVKVELPPVVPELLDAVPVGLPELRDIRCRDQRLNLRRVVREGRRTR
jgi:hypothetical protein